METVGLGATSNGIAYGETSNGLISLSAVPKVTSNGLDTNLLKATCKELSPSSRGQATVHRTVAFYFRVLFEITKKEVIPFGMTSFLATSNGLEPSTSSVTGWRANRLHHEARTRWIITDEIRFVKTQNEKNQRFFYCAVKVCAVY